MQWINGNALIPVNFTLGFKDMMGGVFGIDEEEVSRELAIVNSRNYAMLNGEQASQLLFYYKNNPQQMTLEVLGRLLSFDEGVIRAESVKIWLRLSRSNDDTELVRIFNDDHPSVAYGTLEGVQRGWADYTQERKDTILEGLAKMSSQVPHALAMMAPLIIFERQENPPWIVFETIFPKVMDVLPANAVFNDARFFEVIRVACGELSPSAMVKLCDVWMRLLQRLVSAEKVHSDWLLSVIDILIAATKAQPELRSNSVQKLLAINSTSALLVFIKDLVASWQLLTTQERQALLAVITSERRDVYWLQDHLQTIISVME